MSRDKYIKHGRASRFGGVVSRTLDRAGISKAGGDINHAWSDVSHIDEKPLSNKDFNAWVSELCLTEDKLKEKHDAIYRVGVIYAIMSIVSAVIIGITVIVHGLTLILIISMTTSMLLLSHATKMFFRACQIRHRKLMTFREFLHMPTSEWF